MIHVYLAAPVVLRVAMAHLIERSLDWMKCTSRWITDPDWFTQTPGDMARGDLEDVDRSDAVVIHASRRGWGHAVELGYALARGKRVLVTADMGFDNAFVHLTQVERCAGWDDVVTRLRPTRADRVGDSQPLPTRNARPDVQSLLIRDVEARRRLGIERYGTALQAFNGRAALRDLYEELLDAAAYARQRLEEDHELEGLVAHLWACPLEPFACGDALHARAGEVVSQLEGSVASDDGDA